MVPIWNLNEMPLFYRKIIEKGINWLSHANPT